MQRTPDTKTDDTSPRILLAEDDGEMRTMLTQILGKAGYHVVECGHGWELLDHLGSFIIPDEYPKKHYDLIISDIRMPGISGLSILQGMYETKHAPPIILITAFGDDKTHMEAERYGAAGLFDKPFDIDDLMAKVREILPQ